jgi:mannose-6-phosphate isomerase-like protein (cupin superfamily)
VTGAAPGAPPGSAAISAPSLPPRPDAAIVDVPAPEKTFDRCAKVAVTATKGTVTAFGETLAPGDVLVLEWPRALKLDGAGQAVVAAMARSGACPAGSEHATEKRVVRASAAPGLAWANGQMRAHLDIGQDILPEFYLGRLEGTLPVAEHAHDESWEVLCALEASGTFTLNGRDNRLGPGGCVALPPGARHAWKPDPGTRLVAVQIYSPPGPEQRFKKLAQEAADATAPAPAAR